MKIKISSIMAILLYHIIFINLYYVEKYSLIIQAFALILFFYLALKMKFFINSRYLKVNILLFSFISIMLISSIVNVNAQRGVFQVVKLLEVFLFFEYIKQIGNEKNTIRIFTILTFIYIIINDLLMFLSPSLFYLNNSNYLLGNKFQVSYIHILLPILYMYYNSLINKKDVSNMVASIITLLFAMFISAYTECTTGLVGTILFTVFYFCMRKKNKKVNAKAIIIVLLISCSILLIFSNIVKLKPVEYIIVNILHEDVTLTGRTIIYENIFNIIGSKWLLGYGYGNSYDVMSEQLNYPNTQNALLEYWLTTGIAGMILLIILIYKILNNYNKNINSLIIYLLVFCILGSIEITISTIFLAVLAIINEEDNKIYNNKKKILLERGQYAKKIS